MVNLSRLLSGKVDKEILLSKIKYDTLMVEKQDSQLLLGINVSSVNKKGDLIKNIELNHKSSNNQISNKQYVHLTNNKLSTLISFLAQTLYY